MTPREIAVAWMPGTRHGSSRSAWQHPEDVVGILVEARGGPVHAGLEATAWLHDIIEDGRIARKVGDGYVTCGDLFDQDIDPCVVRDVWRLTRRPGESKTDYLTRLLSHRKRFDWLEVRTVKVADRIANLREGKFTKTDEWLARYKDQARDFILPLCEGAGFDTLLDRLYVLLLREIEG